MKIPEKARNMIDYLREQICIGHFSSGTKLPPIRDLQEQFDISYTSANRGIDYLCEIGIVEKRPRSGVYVKTESSAKKQTGFRIALFISAGELRKPHGIYSTVFLGIQRFAEERQCSLSVNYLPIDDAEPKSFADAETNADAMILLAEYDTSLTSFSAAAPTIGVCMHKTLGGKLSLLDIDPYQSANLACGYFQRNGMKKVVVISRKDTPYSYNNRENVFEDFWIKSGAEIERKFASEKIQWKSDTGYFFATSSILQSCSEQCLKETGETLAQRVVTLGIDGKNLINPDFHYAPAVTLNWQLVGRYAMEECLYRINNPGTLPKRIYLPGNLVEQ